MRYHKTKADRDQQHLCMNSSEEESMKSKNNDDLIRSRIIFWTNEKTIRDFYISISKCISNRVSEDRSYFYSSITNIL